METSRFDFVLPEASIALKPCFPRDHARLLVVRSEISGASFEDRYVFDLPDLLQEGDVLVLNDTKVVPARVFGTRQRGGERQFIEFLFHHFEGAHEGLAFAKPLRRLKVGDQIFFEGGPAGERLSLKAVVAEKTEDGSVRLVFQETSQPIRELLFRLGELPLPPYIVSKRAYEASDFAQYQTVYAQREGAIAAPTAGLHFTETLLEALKARGVALEKITLHVGVGTFAPVKSERLEEHVMHKEWGEIPEDVAQRLTQAKRDKRRIIAVGTTCVRLLEAATLKNGAISSFSGETDLFITPGYRFLTVQGMLTNFHLPRSTLFMLVCAACGLETMQEAYALAIARGYRFYSYGDASLLLFDPS